MYIKLYNLCAKIGWDRWAHCLVFCVLTSFLLRYLEPIDAVPMVATFGIMKEIYDKLRGGIIDWHDLLADAVGIILGFV